MNKHLTCLLTFLVAYSTCFGATYYVDNAVGAGDSATYNPATRLATGGSDTCYELFQDGVDAANAADDIVYIRAGTYREEIALSANGTEDHPIIISQYQSEEVLLDGRELITGWTRCLSDDTGLTRGGQTNKNYNSIFWAEANTSESPQSDLWRLTQENGVFGFQGRWPAQSEGYGLDPEEFQEISAEAEGLSTSIRDNVYMSPTNASSPFYEYTQNMTPTQLDDFFIGVTVQIWFKTDGNTTRSYDISDCVETTSTMSFGTSILRQLVAEDAFCYYDSPHLVNAAGKFYWGQAGTVDTDDLIIYYWPYAEASVGAGTEAVSMPVLGTGITGNSISDVTIDGITITGYGSYGIYISQATSTRLTIQNCTVSDSGDDGIYLLDTADCVIDNCVVTRVGDRGIFMNGGTNGTIKNSTASENRGTNISMYGMDVAEISGNLIKEARGVHVNGLSCYLGCKSILIAKNKFDPHVNIALQNIGDFCLFANVLDGNAEVNDMCKTNIDSHNSNFPTRGAHLYLNNTFINSNFPFSMLLTTLGSGTFVGVTIDSDSGKVRLSGTGEFTSSEFVKKPPAYDYPVFIYCDFSATYTDGWYAALSNTSDTCTIDLAWSTDVPTATGKVGGRPDDIYMHNNIIQSTSWERNITSRTYNWWLPYPYGGTYSVPSPTLDGEVYTYYTNRATEYAACFNDLASADYRLKADSKATHTGIAATIASILADATVSDSGNSVNGDFPNFDFTTDINGVSWNSPPSMGAYEYVDIGGGAPTVDTTAPTPTTATWATAPTALGSSSITMVATTGTETTTTSLPVLYKFTETTGGAGGTDLDYQESPIYTDYGLDASTEYTYNVQMRNSASSPTEGTVSANASATTLAADVIDITNSVVLYYKMNAGAANTTVTDSSANSLNGVASVNTSNLYVADDAAHPDGLGAGFYDFLAAESVLITDAGAVLDWGIGDFTITAWVQSNDAASTGVGRRIFDGDIADYAPDIAVYARDSATDELRWRFPRDAGITDYISPTTPTSIMHATEWRFVCVTVDRDGEVGFWINTDTTTLIEDGSSSLSDSGYWDNAAPQTFLYNLDTIGIGTSSYTGAIDNFQVFNRVLSDEEISFLFNGGDGTEDLATAVVLDPPVQAILPSPANNYVDHALEVELTWQDGGTGATSYNVYFDTVDGSTLVSSAQTGLAYSPTGITTNQTYYWRVDATNDAGTTTGTVWSFDTIDFVTYSTIGQIEAQLLEDNTIHIQAGTYILASDMYSGQTIQFVPIGGDVIFDGAGNTITFTGSISFDTTEGTVSFIGQTGVTETVQKSGSLFRGGIF